MRFLFSFAIMMMTVSCSANHQITPQDIMNAQACLSEVRAVPSQLQSSIPSCMSLAQTIKTEAGQ
ncbi:MAG: hypothetical protein C5B60_03935 [Chloroflexi bacterium]|nr:MAG: hypothetical protein C5B60_03935 [Chloroflexota bacterium]